LTLTFVSIKYTLITAINNSTNATVLRVTIMFVRFVNTHQVNLSFYSLTSVYLLIADVVVSVATDHNQTHYTR